MKYLLATLLVLFCLPALAEDKEDPRSFMHGISAVEDGKGGDWIFFASSGLPPKGDDNQGNWTHDIYVANWRPGQAGKVTPRSLIAKPEAQEPVAAARATNGNILVTFEDGWDTYGEVEQRLTTYDSDLNPIVPYYKTVSDGGHSGHAAAVGNRFVVFYSDEWIKGGGVDNLGSGNGVYASIYDNRGKLQREVPIVDKKREWWPLVAGGSDRALLVWQAFVKGETYAQLKYSMLDPASGIFSEPENLQSEIQYYTYSTAYIPGADRFIIAGTDDDGRGFAYLIDPSGEVAAEIGCMPAIVREAGIAVTGSDVFIPTVDNRLLHLHATGNSLTIAGTLPSKLKWNIVGSAGLPNGPKRLHWFSLAESGLQEEDVDLSSEKPLTDSCQ